MPRLKSSDVLIDSIRSGLGLLTWERDSFGYAESFDETEGRYRGLQFSRNVAIEDAEAPGLLVKPDAVRRQLDAERVENHDLPVTSGSVKIKEDAADGPESPSMTVAILTSPSAISQPPTRFHGTVELEPTRVGRDAGRIADEVITHLAGLVGAKVRVTLEIEAEVPGGAPENVVRTVTENSRTLKFTNHGFERE